MDLNIQIRNNQIIAELEIGKILHFFILSLCSLCLFGEKLDSDFKEREEPDSLTSDNQALIPTAIASRIAVLPLALFPIIYRGLQVQTPRF